MSMSNYEVQVMLGCLDCEYADKKKLEEMKKHHDVQNWLACSEVKGSCTYPFRRDLNMHRGRYFCDHSNIDHFETGELKPKEEFMNL